MQIINNKIVIARGETASVNWKFRYRDATGNFKPLTFGSATDNTEAPKFAFYFYITESENSNEVLKRIVLVEEDGAESNVIVKGENGEYELSDMTLLFDASLTEDLAPRTYSYQAGLYNNEVGLTASKIPLIPPTDFVVEGGVVVG